MTDKKAEQEKDSVVKKLLSSNLTWSVVALIVLIIICTISDHQFLSLSWNKNTGGLSGPLITMLQESARYLMIATGMTLVISTAGIDLSVGSVMAVAGAAAMQLLSAGVNVWMVIHRPCHRLHQRCTGLYPGTPAVHHDIDYDARRARPRQGDHLRPEHRRQLRCRRRAA